MQSELKVRPGFGAVAMKNVRKTKCAEQDRTCRQVQFKSVSDPDAKRAARIDGFEDKAHIPALAGCPEHGERAAPDLDADAVASKFPGGFPRRDLSKRQLAFLLLASAGESTFAFPCSLPGYP